MAKNFRADQIEVSQIILSGGISTPAGRAPRLGAMIYSGTTPPVSDREGGRTGPNLNDVGKDVMLFVSGNSGGKGYDHGSITLFGGDVVVSGTLYAERQVIEVDEEVTGSLWVSGSLAVSQSVDIHGWGGQIHSQGPYLGLHFTSQPNAQAIGWDGLDGAVDAAIWEATDDLHLSASRQVVILSSSYGTGGGTSLDNRNFADTNFFVSGTIGSRGTLVRGTSVFGGDVHISGNLSIDGTGGGGSSEWARAAGAVYPNTPDTTNVLVGDTGVGTADHVLYADGRATFNQQKLSSGDFIVHGNTAGRTLLDLDQIAAPTNAAMVLVLSGGAGESPNEKTFTDVAFFVSGTKGATNQASSRGVALFGGDLVISGALHGGSPLRIGEYRTDLGADVALFVSGTVGSAGTPVEGASLFGGDVTVSGSLKVFNGSASGGTISGSIHHTEDGLSYLIAGDGIAIASGSNGQITITNDGTVGDITAVTAGVGLTGGGNSGDVTVDVDYEGIDNFIDACPNNLEGTAVATGDTIVYHDADDNNVKKGFVSDLPFLSNVVEDTTPELGGQLVTGDHKIAFATGDNTSEIDFTYNGGGNFTAIASVKSIDMFLDSNGGDSGQKFRIFNNLQPTSAHAGGTNTDTNAIFMVQETGNVLAKGYVTASMGLSGSLTRLTDGTSYLVAGPNITITSASNGQVTIESSAGGGGTPGGSNTQVQFNDGGSFGGISGAVTDGSAITFSDSGILVGQDITHAGDLDTKIVFADNSIGFTAGNEQLIMLQKSGQDLVQVGDGGDVDFQVRALSDDNALFVQGSTDRVGIGTDSPSKKLHVAGDVHVVGTAPIVSIQRDNNNDDSTISFLGSGGNTGAIAHLANTNDLVFKTHNGSSPEEMLRLGSHYGVLNRQVILLSGSGVAASAMQPKESLDINFFASGSIGSKGTSNRGTGVFGGDLVVSGVLHVESSADYQAATNAAIVLSAGTSGRSAIAWDAADDGLFAPDAQIYENGGDLYLSASSDVRIRAEQGNIHVDMADRLVISEDPGASGKFVEIFGHNGSGYQNVLDIGDTGVFINDDKQAQYDFRVSSLNKESAIFVNAGDNQVLILSGGAPISNDEGAKPDVNFYVSGSVGSMGSAVRGTSVFGGDFQVSGSAVIGAKRQDFAEIHGLEVSGSSRAGSGFLGRQEFIKGAFTYNVENASPRFIPLASGFNNLTFTVGKIAALDSAITVPHNGTIKEIRLTLSGASGNVSNPGNSRMAFYTSTGTTANLQTIDQAGSALTFASAPSGFVRALSDTVNISNDDGQTWLFTFNNTTFSKDRVFLIAIGFTNGVSSASQYHCSYTAKVEYNEFS